MSIQFKDYYEVLGLKRDASADEIQTAYRKLARKYHPDRNKEPEAEQRFAEIGEAYEVLKDPEKRRKYDQLGANWKNGQDFTPPPGFEQFMRGNRGAGSGPGAGFSFHGSGFSEFFDAIFGSQMGGGRTGGAQGFDFDSAGGPFNRTAQHTPPQEHELQITLEEAYHGGSRQLTLQGPEGMRTLDVKIPAGTIAGQKIRVKGQGGGGADLILKLNINPHPHYDLAGANLTTDVKIAPWEAALGAKVPVRTLDGEVTLTIPPGTSSGSRLRLTGKGLPKRDQSRGDLFARVKIVVPKILTEEEKQLFAQLSKESRFDPRG